MLLVIDIGNTNTALALFAVDGALVRCWRLRTEPERTADEYAVLFTQLATTEHIDTGAIRQAIASSVVPQANFAIRCFIRDTLGCDVRMVGDPATCPVTMPLHVDAPHEVGADRLVNAVAARTRYEGGLIIVDFGTATTFDVVSAEGAYEGGLIAPGIHLSLEALHQAAAQLPRIAIRRPEAVIGKSTVSAMQSGIYWGYVGMIEGIIARIREVSDGPMQTIATGGLASLFAGATASIDHLDEDLTIWGLYVLAGD